MPKQRSLADRKTAERQVAEAQAVLLKEACRRDPLFWLANFVKTAKTGKNRKPDETAVQPFPMRRYVAPIVKEWMSHRILHIAKSRQMGVSWLCQAMLVWEAQFYDHKLCVIINKAKEDSEDGVERAKMIYENQPVWLKNMCPLDRKMKDMPKDTLFFANKSKLHGLPQGPEKVRGLVPATALLDEATYQDQLESTFAACVPCCSKIITVSSAGPGYFKRLCKE